MKAKSVRDQLRNNYFVMIFLTTLLTILGVVWIGRKNTLNDKENIYNLLSAPNMMKDDFKAIDTTMMEYLGGGMQVVSSDFKLLYTKGKRIFDGEQITPGEFSDYLVHTEELNQVVSTAYNEKEGFWLIVSLPIEIKASLHIDLKSKTINKYGTFRTIGEMIGAVLLIQLFSIFVYSRITSRFFVAPLQRLAKTVELFRAGEHSARSELYGSREFRDLQQAFNDMAQEIETQMEQKELSEQKRKKLMMDISHNLKNPLMSVVGFAEMIPKETDHKMIEQYANIILSNGYRANELVLDLFELSQMENPEFQLKCEKGDFTEYFRGEIIRMLPELEKSGLHVDIEIPEKKLSCNFDGRRMRRVISNLLFNAIAYCGGRGEMIIQVKEETNGIQITFTNSIHKEEKNSEVDSEKNMNEYYHVGLGLSIVKKIVSLHGGTVTIDEREYRSFKIQIFLPGTGGFL